MISFVRGTVVSVSDARVVLDVGVLGVELLPTARCRRDLQAGQQAVVPVSLVVREDGWTLYGFADDNERACFQTLQTAKGVGPRVALSVLGALTPEELRSAVAAGDSGALTIVPGIGPKGAQRLVIDLRDRLGPVVPSAREAGLAPAAAGWRNEVQLALVGLGWTAGDANAAVGRIEAEARPGGQGCRPDGSTDAGLLLRLALRSLDRGAAAR